MKMDMRLYRWLKKETLHILPVFLFFAIAFTVINWSEKYFFEKAGLSPFSFIEILIAAGVVAKVFLVIDHFSWVDLFRKTPLFYRILWKTFVYWAIILFVRIAIHYIHFLIAGDGFRGSYQMLLSRVHWRLFFSIQCYYAMLLFIYSAARDLTEIIGAEKMRKIFFGR